MHRYEQFSVGELTVENIYNASGNNITYGANPSGGMDYFVDNNYGSSGNDGLTWMTALDSLAGAVTLSNANIANDPRIHHGGFCSRNRIFYRADVETIDLVTFPNKCDVIGVGSYDANTKPGITGNHVPVNAGNYGTRFINMWFKAPADASPLFTLASSSSGIQFVDCTLSATATTTIGIQNTASPFMKVIGCRFEGAFATSYISLVSGEVGGTEILGNRMVDAAAVGILTTSATASWGCIVADNFIRATTLCVDDNADILYGYRNYLSSAATNVAAYTQSMDVTLSMWAGNFISTANLAGTFPVLDTSS